MTGPPSGHGDADAMAKSLSITIAVTVTRPAIGKLAGAFIDSQILSRVMDGSEGGKHRHDGDGVG